MPISTLRSASLVTCWIALSTSTLLAQQSENATAMPSPPGPQLLREDADYRVFLQQFVPQGGGSFASVLELRIENKTTGSSATLMVDEGGWRELPVAASIVGPMVAILGASWDAERLVVLNAEPPFAVVSVVERPMLVFSTDRTKVAFETQAEVPVSEGADTDSLSIIDLTADPLRARVVYPPANALTQDPVRLVRESGGYRIHSFKSRCVWRSDDKKLVLVDSERVTNSAPVMNLIEVDLTKGIATPTWYRLTIDASRDLQLQGAGTDLQRVAVRQLGFLSTTAVQALFKLPDLPTRQVQLPLPSSAGVTPIPMPTAGPTETSALPTAVKGFSRPTNTPGR